DVGLDDVIALTGEHPIVDFTLRGVALRLPSEDAAVGADHRGGVVPARPRAQDEPGHDVDAEAPRCRTNLLLADPRVELGEADASRARPGRGLEQGDRVGNVAAVPHVVEEVGLRTGLNGRDLHGCAHGVLRPAAARRGSRRSRWASPRRLKPSTASMMASPGASTSQGAMVMYWRPRLSMLPGRGNSAPPPRG